MDGVLFSMIKNDVEMACILDCKHEVGYRKA